MRKTILLIYMLLVSTFSFSQWTTLSSGTKNYLSSVYFPNANTGYVVGDSGTILKTINAGTKWTTQMSGTENYLASVCFTAADTGYIVGVGGIILKTMNGGAAWTNLSSGTNKNLVSVRFTDSHTGYAVGDSGTILKTINGGTTWTALSSGIPNDLTSIYFPDFNTGYAVGLYGSIVKTTNAGTDWTVLTVGSFASSYVFLSDYFLNANTGFVVGGFIGGSGGIWKTVDGGATWSGESGQSDFYFYSVYCTNADTGFTIGEAGTVRKTFFGGAIWDTMPNGTLNDLHSMFFTDYHTAYLVGALGTILKTSNGGGYPEGLNDLSAKSNTLLVYPNPSSTLVTIESTVIPVEGQLSIINLAGQEVLTRKVDQTRTKLDITNLPDGVYIVKLINSGTVEEGKILKQ